MGSYKVGEKSQVANSGSECESQEREYSLSVVSKEIKKERE